MNILIKLSGEGLSKGESRYNEASLYLISDQIKELLGLGHQIFLVIGGGNIFRGKDLTGKLSVEATTGDYIGMLATVQNALVLRDYFNGKGIDTRVMSAISMPQICESYIPKRALRHAEKGRVVIFGGGLGLPFFTTDSASVQRALEMKSDLLIMAKNGVDGIYTGDPKLDSTASFIKNISASEILDKKLKVADLSAIALARDNSLKIRVVNTSVISKALSDEDLGSTIEPK